MYPRKTTVLPNKSPLVFDKWGQLRSKILLVLGHIVVWSSASGDQYSLTVCDVKAGRSFDYPTPKLAKTMCGELSEDGTRVIIALICMEAKRADQREPELLVLEFSVLPEIGSVVIHLHIFLRNHVVFHLALVFQMSMMGNYLAIWERGSIFLCDWRNSKGAEIDHGQDAVSCCVSTPPALT